MSRRPTSILLALLAPGCAGVPLWGADLTPPARNTGAPIAVEVSAATATEDLLRTSVEVADEQSELVLRVHVQNQSSTVQSVDPGQFRLMVVGAGGRQVEGLPAAWGVGELPTYTPAGKSGVVSIPPGQQVTLWVAFQRLTGLPLSSAARITLVPGAAPALTLSEPAAPAPRWEGWSLPRAVFLRGGFSGVGSSNLATVELQSLFAHGPTVFGTNLILLGDLHEVRKPSVAYSAGGIGLVAGFVPRAWPGVVFSADGMWGYSQGDGGRLGDNIGMLRVSAALRVHGGLAVGIGGGAIPVAHRERSPLGSVTYDIGYVHTFVRGGSGGGGLLVMVGAPLYGW